MPERGSLEPLTPAHQAAHQRAGLGRRLMSEALARADADQVPAYLWTANPDNLPYYRSYGYDVIGESVIPGGATTWYMERPAVWGCGAPRRLPAYS